MGSRKQRAVLVAFLVFIFTAVFLVSSISASAAVSSGTAILNATHTSYINFSDGTVSNFSGHVKWDNRSGIPLSAWATSGTSGFFNASPGKIHSLGQKDNITVFSVPNGSDKIWGDHLFYENSSDKIYGSGDGFAVITSNNTYAFIGVVGVTAGVNVTIIWKFQSNGTTSFSAGSSDPVITGCLKYTTEPACWNASASGSSCYWDNFLKSCQDAIGGGGGGGGGAGGGINHTTDCPAFDGNQKACGNITVCTWISANNWCDPNSNFNYDTGVICPNFVNQSACDNQPHTKPLCTWIAGNNTCAGNSTKTFTNLPTSPFTNCEDAVNKQNCTEAIETYFMPCKFKNVSNKEKCTAELHGIFGGETGGSYFDINTKGSCEASGGTLKTEQYTYTDQYGNTQTASSSWCEPSFGNYDEENCDDSCWACEKNETGGNWPNATTAALKCKNSTLGFCKFITDTSAFNSQGWCEPESYIQFGFKDCSTDCFGCFKNDTCRVSNASCSWVPDPLGFDTNYDGTVNSSEDGFCDKKLVAEKKDCSKTCFACQTQNACTTSAATCSWNTTGSAFGAYCHSTGTAQEVCFLPGDEDNDGQSDCADVNSCNQDPFCGFGFGGGVGGAGLGLGTVNNSACTQHDNSQANCIKQNGTDLMNLTNLCYYHPAPGQESQFPTVGWCDPVFEQQLAGGMVVDSPPVIIGTDGLNDNVSGSNWTDILGIGIHESPGAQDKINIGIGIKNLSHFAGCNKVSTSKTETKNLTLKFYRFIDSDNNMSTGCWANGTLPPPTGAPVGAQFNESGFDYKFFYTENTTSGDIKVAFKCVSGTWAPFTAQLGVMKDLCKMDLGGAIGATGPGVADFLPSGAQVMVISKVDFGNPKGAIRLFTMTANSSTNRTELTDSGAGSNESFPVDIAGPYYYTPGSIDKKFEDCTATGQDTDGDGLTADNDPDCTLFKKFGFVPFEGGPQCTDGKDNDNNGKTDCADFSCKYDPFSGCGFGMTCDSTDKSPPALKWFEAATFPEGAAISFDSDEPANGTVTFYSNDSKCNILNSTMLDFGLNDSTIGNEYRSWHDTMIDKSSVGATLSSNKTYYFKYKMCDLCGNCMISACQNFTTATSYKSYVFKPVPLAGLQIDIPQLGVTGDNMTYGKQVNASIGQNIDVTVKDPNIGYNITLHNVSVFAAATINISTIYNSNSTSKMVGMNTSSWNTVLQKLGVKYVTITFPDNGTKLVKCAEDNITNCVDVSSNATCTYGTSVTNCTIPVGAGLGFSYYGVQGSKTFTSGGGSSSSSSGGGSGGGGSGGGGGSALVSENFLIQKELKAGDIATAPFKKFADIAVSEITFTADSAATNPSISVRETKLATGQDPPIEKESGAVYKYLSITKSVIANVSGATIKFSVPNGWFANNSLDPSTVSLNRLVSGSWEKLPTKQLSSDAKFTNYEAESPSFSVFAIAARKAVTAAAAPEAPKAEAPAPPQAPTTGLVTQEEVEAAAEKPSVEKKGGLGSAAKIIIGAVLTLLGILAAVEIMHKMHGKSK